MTPGLKLAALCGAFACVAFGLGWAKLPVPSSPNDAAPARSAAAPRSPAAPENPPGTIRDPLSPDRPVTIDTTDRADAGNWVTARPGFQYSHTAAQRGGVEPCATQSVDTSAFSDWVSLGQGRFTAPTENALDAEGNVDLVIHLLGNDPIRRELALSGQHFALYTLTIDVGSSYAKLFSGTKLMPAIVSEVEHALSEHSDKPAHVRHLAVSAWSAGFTGVAAMLAQPEADRIDSVILIDGLHAARDPQSFELQLEPFLAYAKRAAAGERLFIVTHSSIDPVDYASTTETSHYLISTLGGRPQAVRRDDPLGLELVEYFSSGNFHVRGYAGNDKADHCAQLGLLRMAYAALGRRWAH